MIVVFVVLAWGVVLLPYVVVRQIAIMFSRLRQQSTHYVRDFFPLGEMYPLDLEVDAEALLALLLPAGLWNLYQAAKMFPPMPWWDSPSVPKIRPSNPPSGVPSPLRPRSTAASTTPIRKPACAGSKPDSAHLNPFLWSAPPQQVRLIRKRAQAASEPRVKRKLVLEYLRLPPMDEIAAGVTAIESHLGMRVILKHTGVPENEGAMGNGLGARSADTHNQSLEITDSGDGAAAGSLTDHVVDRDWVLVGSADGGVADVGSMEAAGNGEPLVPSASHSAIVRLATPVVAIHRGVERLGHAVQQHALRNEMGLGRLEFGFPFFTVPRNASPHANRSRQGAEPTPSTPSPVRVEELHDDTEQAPEHDSGIVEDSPVQAPVSPSVVSPSTGSEGSINDDEEHAPPAPFVRIEELDDYAEDFAAMQDSGIVLAVDHEVSEVNEPQANILPDSCLATPTSDSGMIKAGVPENMVRDLVLAPRKSFDESVPRSETSPSSAHVLSTTEESQPSSSKAAQKRPVAEERATAATATDNADDDLYSMPERCTRSQAVQTTPRSPSPCPSGKAILAAVEPISESPASPQLLNQQADELRNTLNSLVIASPSDTKGKSTFSPRPVSPPPSEPTSPVLPPKESSELVVAKRNKPMGPNVNTIYTDNEVFADPFAYVDRPLTPASSIKSLHRWSSFTRASCDTGLTTPPQSRPGSSATLRTPMSTQKMLPWTDDDTSINGESSHNRSRGLTRSVSLTLAQKRGQLLHSATLEKTEHIDRPLGRSSSLAERSRNKIQTPIVLPPPETLTASSVEAPKQFPFPDICYVSDAATQTLPEEEVSPRPRPLQRLSSLNRPLSTTVLETKTDGELDGIKELFEELAEVEMDIQRVAQGEEARTLPELELTMTDVKDGLPVPERLELLKAKKKEKLMKRLRERARHLKTKVVGAVKKHPMPSTDKGKAPSIAA